jgi:hypothetical protein
MVLLRKSHCLLSPGGIGGVMDIRGLRFIERDGKKILQMYTWINGDNMGWIDVPLIKEP